MKQEQGATEGAWATALMVAALVGIYMVSQFFRNSVGVVGPDLARDFDLKAADLGILSSTFFLSFAAAQIPLGIAIDRWGPKRPMLATAGIMLAGTAVFAFAQGFAGLTLGRALIGIGCSSFYMGPLAIYARRFPPEKFGSMTGLQLGAGTTGTLAATAPLAFAAEAFGWRIAFLGVGAVGILMTLAVLLLVPADDRTAVDCKGGGESLARSIAGVGEAMGVPDFWKVFFLQLASYAPFAAILGLWAAPWLQQVYGIGPETRGAMLFALAVAQVAGLFFWGSSDRWLKSYKKPIALGAGGAVLILTGAALFGVPKNGLWAFFIVFGFVCAFTPMVTAHGKTLFPARLTARGLTLMNIGTIGGVFLQQTITGYVVEAFGYEMTAQGRSYPPEAYAAVFAVLAAQLALALLFYLRIADRHPLKQER